MENIIGFVELNDDYIWLQKYLQDPNAENQVFSPSDDERKDKEPLDDDYISQSENVEEGYDVLDAFESEKKLSQSIQHSQVIKSNL